MTIQLPHRFSAACTLSSYFERVDAGLWCIQGYEIEHLGCAAHRCFDSQAHLPYTATISRGLASYFIPQPCVRKPQIYHSSSISMSSLRRLSAQAKPFQHRTAPFPSGDDRNWRYIYGALETPTTIRVLRLEPGLGNEPLKGEILHTDLATDNSVHQGTDPRAHGAIPGPNGTFCGSDDRDSQEQQQHSDKSSRSRISYEALSYVWGRPGLNEYLKTSSGIIVLTQSLAAALRHLRRVDGPRNIWADGICINQRDHKEKGPQVRMMDRVYSSAERVLVWLGEDPENVGQKVFSELTDYVTFGLRWNVSEDEQPAAVVMANDILQSEWFSRVWVVQEYVLARNVLFVWGNAQLANWVMCRLVNELGSNIANTWLTYFSGPVHEHFLEVLRNTRGLSCSDDRDRIYGLIGIRYKPSPLSDAVAGLQPDYVKSVQRLYSEFACICVKKMRFYIFSAKRVILLRLAQVGHHGYQTGGFRKSASIFSTRRWVNHTIYHNKAKLWSIGQLTP